MVLMVTEFKTDRQLNNDVDVDVKIIIERRANKNHVQMFTISKVQHWNEFWFCN